MLVVIVLIPMVALPPRTRTFTIPRSITIQDDNVGASPSREKELRRFNSISMTTGPQHVNTPSRIIGEFR